MKTKLDQISIPPRDNGMSKMAHTLVGKAMRLQLKGGGFNPRWGQSTGPLAGLGHIEKKVFFAFLVFFCALILSPLLGTPENAGVM